MPKQAPTKDEPIKIYQPIPQNNKKIRNRYGSTNPRGEDPKIFSPKLSDTEISKKSKPVNPIKKLQQSQIQTMKKIKNDNNSEQG